MLEQGKVNMVEESLHILTRVLNCEETCFLVPDADDADSAVGSSASYAFSGSEDGNGVSTVFIFCCNNCSIMSIVSHVLKVLNIQSHHRTNSADIKVE